MSKLANLFNKNLSQTERVTTLYSRIAAVDVVKTGRWISSTKASFTTESQDIHNNAKIRKLQYIDIKGNELSVDGPGIVIDAKPLHYSPSGKYTVSCFKTGETFRIDVSSKLGLEASISGSPAQPIADPNLQYLTWRNDESGFVYVGEKASQKSTKLWDVKPTATQEDIKVALKKSTWETNDNWGECFAENSCFTLYYVDISTGKVFDLISDEFSQRNSSVSPLLIPSAEGECVLFTAVDHEPRRLGIVYCRNRPTKSFTVPIDTKQVPTEVLSLGKFRGTINGRIHGDKIAFFAQASTGSVAVPNNFPHNCAASLHVTTVAALLNPKTNPDTYFNETVVVPIITSTPSDADKGFHGLYPPTGNDLFWARNGSTLLVNSVARSSTKVYEVSLANNNSITPLEFCESTQSGQWTILDVREDNVLVHKSELLRGSSIAAHQLATRATSYWQVGSSFPFDDISAMFSTEMIRVPSAHDSEAIYTKHNSDTNRPTVVIVHGGPHSTDTNGFASAQLLYLLEGWNLFSINYGGSLGFGQHRIQELMGTVATNDVGDCIACIDSMKGKWNADQLVIYGGSHGGFLAGHLTGRYPSLFKAAIIRNPVMNIASAHYETDIPDWTVAVTDIDEDNVDIAKMFSMSPIIHAPKVTAATLLGIGLEDKRVLPAQGRSWYHALKAAQAKPLVRMIEYPENSHALDGVHASADFAIRGVIFASEAIQ